MPSTCTNSRFWLLAYCVVGASILASSTDDNNNNNSNSSSHETYAGNNNNIHIQTPIDDEQMLMLTKQLREIEGISDCSYATLCTTPTVDHRYFPNVPVGSSVSFAQLAKEKVDLVASFVLPSKSTTKDDIKLITNILQAIKSTPDVQEVRFLMFYNNTPNQSKEHWLYALTRDEELISDFDSDFENNMMIKEEAVKFSNISETDLVKFPWFIKPPLSPRSEQFREQLDFSFSSQDASANYVFYSHNSDKNKMNLNGKPMRGRKKGHTGHHGNANGGAGGPEFSYWTWPYFLCSKFNSNSNTNSNNINNRRGGASLDTHSNNNNNKMNINQNTQQGDEGSSSSSTGGNQSEQIGHKSGSNSSHNKNSNNNNNVDDRRCSTALDGRFLVSYTAGFHMHNQNKKAYGILSFDVDLSNYDINQCDYESEEERAKDLKENPLHVFRGTHKCDIKTTTCHFTPGRKWRQGSYECLCTENRYAFRKEWKNSVPGRMAELTYPDLGQMASEEELTERNNSYFNTVSCKKCPDGCEHCIDGENCLAETSWMFRIGLLSVSMVSIACTAGIILIVYKYRRVPVLKSSSPIFHCIVLVGCIIMYTEMVALLPPLLTSSSCIAVKWTRHLGFGITYTALYMKLCRVYLTFRVKSAHKIKLTEKHLLHWMSPIMVIMLLYLTAWTLSDPPSIERMYTTDGKIFIQCVYNWWDHCIGAGEVIFLSYGVWICYRIRSNADAQYISYAIYNIAIINILMVSVHLVILPNAGPDAKYLFAFIRTQMSTTLTIALVFGSKLLAVWGKPTELNKEMPNSANGFGHDTLDLAEENQQLKEELQRLSGQLERLRVFAMGKNNPHLKQSSANISSADLEFNSNRLETFTTL